MKNKYVAILAGCMLALSPAAVYASETSTEALTENVAESATEEEGAETDEEPLLGKVDSVGEDSVTIELGTWKAGQGSGTEETGEAASDGETEEISDGGEEAMTEEAAADGETAPAEDETKALSDEETAADGETEPAPAEDETKALSGEETASGSGTEESTSEEEASGNSGAEDLSDGEESQKEELLDLTGETMEIGITEDTKILKVSDEEESAPAELLSEAEEVPEEMEPETLSGEEPMTETISEAGSPVLDETIETEPEEITLEEISAGDIVEIELDEDGNAAVITVMSPAV